MADYKFASPESEKKEEVPYSESGSYKIPTENQQEQTNNSYKNHPTSQPNQPEQNNNGYKNAPNPKQEQSKSNENAPKSEPGKLPQYKPASETTLYELDLFDAEKIISNLQPTEISWTDIASSLISKGDVPKFDSVANLFSQKALPTAESLIEKYLNGEQSNEHQVAIGGIAGGPKFCVNNILFKFSRDWQNIYGGDDFAMKAAAQELKNINYLISQSSLNRLFNLPLVSLVTKWGLRVYATSLLPLSSNSLKYGSSNAGKTVHKDDPSLNNVFDVIGQTLNLKSHFSAQNDTDKIVGPVDIEGHIGTDGRYYIVDTARLFPPEKPNDFGSGEVYYKILLPDWIRQNLEPINSDVYSPFIHREDKERDEEIVNKLSSRIYSELIPSIASKMSSWESSISNASEVKLFLHQNFLNLRHLPKLLEAILEKKSEKDILTSNALISLISEMVGRVFKRGWYAAVRNEGHDEQWRKQQTISFFKLMFPTQISEDAKNEWNKALKSTLINEFILSDSFVDKFISKITSSELFPILLQKILERTCELCGVSFDGFNSNSRQWENVNESNVKVVSLIKRVIVPKRKTLQELGLLLDKQMNDYGEMSPLLMPTILDLAHEFELSQVPQYNTAQGCYEQCIQIMDKSGNKSTGSGSWLRIHMQLQIAEMLYRQAKFQDAILKYEEVLKQQEASLGPKHSAIAITLNNMAAVYFGAGNAQNAQEIYQKVATLQAETLGKDHREYIKTMSNMAVLLNAAGRYEDCLKLAMETLESQEKSGGKNIYYCGTLQTIGVTCLKLARFDEASRYLSENIETLKPLVGEKHPLYAIALDQMAQYYNSQGRNTDALNLYRQSLEIKGNTYGRTHPSYLTSVNNMSRALQDLGQLEESAKLYEDVANTLRASGTNPALFGTILNNLASIRQAQLKFDESEKLYKEALDVLTKHYGPNHPDVLAIHSNMSGMYMDKAEMYRSQGGCNCTLV